MNMFTELKMASAGEVAEILNRGGFCPRMKEQDCKAPEELNDEQMTDVCRDCILSWIWREAPEATPV